MDLNYLLDMAIFNVLMGNADAQEKNFSLLYTHDGIHLAPFYDLMRMAHHSALASVLAITYLIAGELDFDTVSPWNPPLTWNSQEPEPLMAIS